MAESVQQMMSALTQALQGLSIQRLPPPLKLGKIKGPPKAAGELSIEESLEDFQSYAVHYKLVGEAKAQALLDHLSGVAKDEVLCREESVRKDPVQVVKVFKDLFSATESVPSLSQTFYNRRQQEGETLADYSRALMRLYDHMEKASLNLEDRDALKRLKDNSLKERFICGVKEKWVQREWKRITMANKNKSFLEVRSEVLDFFNGQEPRSSPRVHEVYAERADLSSTFPNQEKGREDSDVKAELADLRKDLAQLAKSVQALTQHTQPRQKFKKKPKCHNCPKEGNTKKDCTEEMVCFNCHQTGHMSRECPKKREAITRPTSQSDSSPSANCGTVRSVVSKEKTNIVDRFVAKSPCCNIFAGGLEIGCVVDTGAEASIIPASLYDTKLRCRVGDFQKSEGIFMNVIGVGGVECPVVGYVELPIKVKGEELMGNFLVVLDRARTMEQMRYPILLGSNILQYVREYKPLYDRMKQDIGDQDKVRTEETDVHIGSVRIHPVADETLPPSVKINSLHVDVHEDAVAGKVAYDEGECDVIKHEIDLSEGPDVRQSCRRIHPLQVPEKQARLVKRAHKRVKSSLQAAAKREEERHDGYVPKAVICVGDRVLLRRQAFTTRHKLADKFFHTSYVVVNKNAEEDVYEIQPATGGDTKRVNRRHLILDPREEDKCEELDNVLPQGVEYSSNSDSEVDVSLNGSDSEVEDEFPYLLMYDASQTRAEPAPLRRSTRSTRGVHRNPSRLPTSALTGLPS